LYTVEMLSRVLDRNRQSWNTYVQVWNAFYSVGIALYRVGMLSRGLECFRQSWNTFVEGWNAFYSVGMLSTELE
jgi:hypothetical protein